MGHSEVDGGGARVEFVELCDFVFGAGEAGGEAVDFAEPALLFGFVDADEEVVVDLEQSGSLGWVGAQERAA